MRFAVPLLACLAILSALWIRFREPDPARGRTLAQARSEQEAALRPPASKATSRMPVRPANGGAEDAREEEAKSLGAIGYASAEPGSSSASGAAVNGRAVNGTAANGQIELVQRALAQAEQRAGQRALERAEAHFENDAAAMTAALSGDDPELAIQAAMAAASLRGTAPPDGFLHALRSGGNARVQREVTLSLSRWGDPALDARLEALATDPGLGADHRAEILGALFESHTADELTSLVGRIRSSPHTADRAALLRAAKGTTDAAKNALVGPLVESALSSTDAAEWGAALDLLANPSLHSAETARALALLAASTFDPILELRVERTLRDVRTTLEAAANE